MEFMSFAPYNDRSVAEGNSDRSSVSDNGSNAAAAENMLRIGQPASAAGNKSTAVATKKRNPHGLRERIFVGRELTAQNLALLNFGL